MGQIERLIQNYDTRVSLPWERNLAGPQRVWFAVYNKAELILAKQRHGPTGKIDLFFEGEFTRFADLDTIHG